MVQGAINNVESCITKQFPNKEPKSITSINNSIITKLDITIPSIIVGRMEFASILGPDSIQLFGLDPVVQNKGRFNNNNKSRFQNPHWEKVFSINETFLQRTPSSYSYIAGSNHYLLKSEYSHTFKSKGSIYPQISNGDKSSFYYGSKPRESTYPNFHCSSPLYSPGLDRNSHSSGLNTSYALNPTLADSSTQYPR